MVMISTDRIRLAELKYFDAKHNGIEYGDAQSYVLLYEVPDKCTSSVKYVNFFDFCDTYPVFKRSKFYGAFTKDGVDFGTKIVPVSDDVSTGPCFLLTDVNFRDVFGRDNVTIDVLENYILKSEKYFKDREMIARRRLHDFREPIGMVRIINKDKKSRAKMEEFFAERGIQKIIKG